MSPDPKSSTVDQSKFEDFEKEFVKLQTEYHSDRTWLFRIFFILLAVVTIVLRLLYDSTTEEIAKKINEELSNIAIQSASDSIKSVMKKVAFISQSADSIYRLLSSKSGFDIMTGSTDPENTIWREYSKDAIMVEVNTANYNFKSTPIFLTSLGGNSAHYVTTGITSIYGANPNGFTVYIKSTIPFKDLLSEAKQSKWHVRWVALNSRMDTRK